MLLLSLSFLVVLTVAYLIGKYENLAYLALVIFGLQFPFDRPLGFFTMEIIVQYNKLGVVI